MTSEHDNNNGHADHPAHLAHHFETPKQQFESGKLGMWLFLATEVLMFGGLFCAYAIYRGNHQNVFLYGYGALDKMWGATNTVVLLASSLTMAWGVRAAQKGQQKLLICMLIATFMGGVGFMCIKGVEYKAKWDHNLFPGTMNAFYYQNGQAKYPEKIIDAIAYIDAKNLGGDGSHAAPQGKHESVLAHEEAGHAIVPASFVPLAEASTLKPPASPADMGVLDSAIDQAGTAQATYADRTKITWNDLTFEEKGKVHLFFSIYFMMTGLHGLHVLIGMVMLAWLIWKAKKGVFGKDYFAPVDFGGLYWHLVDLIWIFLFPLLYLIH